MPDGLETLEEWNELLSCNGCCTMPACPIPVKVCELAEHTSYCADDDYTDALAIWTAKKSKHDSWVVDHYLYAGLHDDWVTCQEATPGECGAEPVDPVEPPLPGSAPSKPAGYNDIIHGCYGPFAEPGVAPSERIPTIYRTLTNDFSRFNIVSGEYYAYAPSINGETLSVSIHDVDGVETITGSANSIDEFDVCGADPFSGGIGVSFSDLPDIVFGTTDYTCTDSVRKLETVDTAQQGTIPLTLVGCPGPWAGSEGIEEAWDLTHTRTETYTLGGGITPSDLITRATANLPTEWTSTAGACESTVTVEWPIVTDLYVERDMTADPPEPGHWLGCAELPDTVHELYTGAQATVKKRRFQWQIDPVLVRDDDDLIIDWWRGDYFKITWQTCFFPKEWDAWKDRYDQYLDDVAAHADWVTAGSIPPEPAVSAYPGAQPTPPTLSADATDTWIGPLDKDDPETWKFPGGFHILDIPPSEGRVAIVNIRFFCYPDSPYGYAPQIMGEGYEPFVEVPPP